jgi:hypothetical protein
MSGRFFCHLISLTKHLEQIHRKILAVIPNAQSLLSFFIAWVSPQRKFSQLWPLSTNPFLWTCHQDNTKKSIENLLEFVANAEVEMNNLPYENIHELIRGLESLLENLDGYEKQNEVVIEGLPDDCDARVRNAAYQLMERIRFLKIRAQNGIDKIKVRHKRESYWKIFNFSANDFSHYEYRRFLGCYLLFHITHGDFSQFSRLCNWSGI